MTAVDFMASFIAKNEDINGHHGNIKFIQADVTKLDFPAESFDIIFSNWLMMYLTDEEVIQLAKNALAWLNKGGFIFFRESCFRPAGAKLFDFNPSVYRKPSYYNAAFQATTRTNSFDGQITCEGFELAFSRSIQSYIKLRNNPNQFCWLMEKVPRENDSHHGFQTFQQFLDEQQYTRQGILRDEKIFGEGYVSTGGLQTTKEFVAMLDLKPRQKVLDVGAGIGGGDFYMAEVYDVEVVGMDLSSNMIEIAMERARDHQDLKTWLKPGGKLLMSDYCCGDLPHTEAFQKYVAQQGCTFCTPQDYGKLLEGAGFINVKAEDRTWQFVEVLEMEKSRVEEQREQFIEEFSEEDFLYLIDGWTNKLVRTGAGDQKWGLFYAEKSFA